MAYIDNSDTTRELNAVINGNSVSNFAPSSVSNQVIPVMEVNPKLLKEVTIYSAISTSSGLFTLVTTPSASTGKFFYITHISFSYSKDSACDLPTGSNSLGVAFYQDGVQKYICRMPTITLLQQQDSVEIDFVNPLKVDAGTNIQIARASTTAGNIVIAGQVAGYIA